jgi:hypothetical protein
MSCPPNLCLHPMLCSEQFCWAWHPLCTCRQAVSSSSCYPLSHSINAIGPAPLRSGRKTGRMHTCWSDSVTRVNAAAHLIQYIVGIICITASCKATATAALPVLGSSLVPAKHWTCYCCEQVTVGYCFQHPDGVIMTTVVADAISDSSMRALIHYCACCPV